jgi:hypothetical protein
MAEYAQKKAGAAKSVSKKTSTRGHHIWAWVPVFALLALIVHMSWSNNGCKSWCIYTEEGWSRQECAAIGMAFGVFDALTP